MNWTTVRSLSSPLFIATASTVGSIRESLNRARSFKRCFQLGACICKWGHFPYGKAMTLGSGPCIIADVEPMDGAVNPRAYGRF